MDKQVVKKRKTGSIAYALVVAGLAGLIILYFYLGDSTTRNVRKEAAKGSFVTMHPGSRRVTGSYGLMSLPLGSPVDPELAAYGEQWSREMVNLVKGLGDDLPEISKEELKTRFAFMANEGKLRAVPRRVPLGMVVPFDEHNSVKWVKGLWNFYVLVFVNDKIGQRYHWWCCTYHFPFPDTILAWYEEKTGILFMAKYAPLYDDRYYCQAVHLFKARELGRVLLDASVIELDR